MTHFPETKKIRGNQLINVSSSMMRFLERNRIVTQPDSEKITIEDAYYMLKSGKNIKEIIHL